MPRFANILDKEGRETGGDALRVANIGYERSLLRGEVFNAANVLRSAAPGSSAVSKRVGQKTGAEVQASATRDAAKIAAEGKKVSSAIDKRLRAALSELRKSWNTTVAISDIEFELSLARIASQPNDAKERTIKRIYESITQGPRVVNEISLQLLTARLPVAPTSAAPDFTPPAAGTSSVAGTSDVPSLSGSPASSVAGTPVFDVPFEFDVPFAPFGLAGEPDEFDIPIDPFAF
jgi:hypothetical protein